MDKHRLVEYKMALEQRKMELDYQLKNHFLNEEFAQEAIGELSNYDNHPGDQGTELFERSKDIALNEHAEKELTEIEQALERMEKGEYGICVECGEDIPLARLQAIPTTNRCIEHTEVNSSRRDRPIEEEVMSPDIRLRANRVEEQVGYGREDAWQEVNRYGSSDTASDFYGDRESFDEMYPNAAENTDGPESIESYIASDSQGKYDENTLNYYRSRHK